MLMAIFTTHIIVYHTRAKLRWKWSPNITHDHDHIRMNKYILVFPISSIDELVRGGYPHKTHVHSVMQKHITVFTRIFAIMGIQTDSNTQSHTSAYKGEESLHIMSWVVEEMWNIRVRVYTMFVLFKQSISVFSGVAQFLHTHSHTQQIYS